ncbi:hypothetical protein P4O66_015248, partial [Electrophorus voltai]
MTASCRKGVGAYNETPCNEAGLEQPDRLRPLRSPCSWMQPGCSREEENRGNSTGWPDREQSSFPGDPPQPLETEEGPAYRVQALPDSQNLVDWEGYGPEEHWFPASKILYPGLISSFHRRHPLKPSPSRQVR